MHSKNIAYSAELLTILTKEAEQCRAVVYKAFTLQRTTDKAMEMEKKQRHKEQRGKARKNVVRRGEETRKKLIDLIKIKKACIIK